MQTRIVQVTVFVLEFPCLSCVYIHHLGLTIDIYLLAISVLLPSLMCLQIY